MDEVIVVEHLSKAYTIARRRSERYNSLREALVARLQSFSPSRRMSDAELKPGRESLHWALDDVSFTVRPGDRIGIIGRNGAGKSTLLKILSRITDPTRGRVTIRGRVASLLEVGTGFHGELTGRENIFLSGAILGMPRAQIIKKFDEIVQFAEVEEFLDVPVKRYSSGMYVRLGFAIAAHLEPDILVVDEVLAVGDAEFQNKCLGKMEEVSKGGRTILFVSHDIASVTNLCRLGILLDKGKIEQQGEMAAVVARYLSGGQANESQSDLTQRGDSSGSGEAKWTSISLLTSGETCRTLSLFSDLRIRVGIEVEHLIGRAQIAIIISTSDGTPVFDLESSNEGMTWNAVPGTYEFEVTIPQLTLYPGRYVIDLWLGDYERNRVAYIKSAASFDVTQQSDSGVLLPLQRSNGLVYTKALWQQRRRDN